MGDVVSAEVAVWPSLRETITRPVAYPNPVYPKADVGADLSYLQALSDGNLMAAGMLVIPAGRSTPVTNTHDYTCVFYVIEGAVKCSVKDTPFRVEIGQGGLIFVPRGNVYHIKNRSDGDARLFISKTRKPFAEAERVAAGGASCIADVVFPAPAADQDMAFRKLFGHDDYMAGGVVALRAGAQKPTKSSKDNTYVLVVLEGTATFTVHATRIRIAQGGTVLVPPGNCYHIQSGPEQEAHLLFTQVRTSEPGGAPVGSGGGLDIGIAALNLASQAL